MSNTVEPTKVTAYTLSDGRVVIDEAEAIKLQSEINVRISVGKLCDHFYFRNMDASDIADAILENREEFLQALSK